MAKKTLIMLYIVYILIILIVVGYIQKNYKNSQQLDDMTATENNGTIAGTVKLIEMTKGTETTKIIEKIETTRTEESIIIETETNKGVDTEEAVQPISLGEFKLTAYCSCIKCCGKWALNRPVDENGKEIVYGAIGERLVEGYSIAVDPNVIPYGTEVIINGCIYKAQDCGGAIKENRIDVYMSDHNKALEFGVQYAEVFIMPR